MARITIRMGAAHNSVEVDGTKIDRNSLSKGEDRKMRGIIIGALEKDRYFTNERQAD